MQRLYPGASVCHIWKAVWVHIPTPGHPGPAQRQETEARRRKKGAKGLALSLWRRGHPAPSTSPNRPYLNPLRRLRIPGPRLFGVQAGPYVRLAGHDSPVRWRTLPNAFRVRTRPRLRRGAWSRAGRAGRSFFPVVRRGRRRRVRRTRTAGGRRRPLCGCLCRCRRSRVTSGGWVGSGGWVASGHGSCGRQDVFESVEKGVGVGVTVFTALV